MSLKDLAKQAGVETTENTVVNNPEAGAGAGAGAADAAAGSTVGDLINQAKTKTPRVKKEKAPKEPRAKVDENTVNDLRAKANEQFGEKPEFDNAKVDFTVAKSKGRFVSLTPKLVYADGAVKSAGPKNRVGFCSNGKFDEWYAAVKEALVSAHTAERKAPTARKTSGQWAAFSVAIKEALGEGVAVKSVSKKLMVKMENDKVTLRRNKDQAEAVVGAASGSISFVTKVIESVKDLRF